MSLLTSPLKTIGNLAGITSGDRQTQHMIAQLPAVLWTTDTHLRFTSSMGSGLAALQLKPNELNGVSLLEYFKTQDPDYLPIAQHRRALAGEPCSYEQTWANRIYQTHLEPLRDFEGKVIGTLGLALDVTEYKRTEAALRQSRQEFDELMHSLEGIVWEVDTPTLQFTFVSKQAERLLGYPTELWLADPSFWRNHLHPEDRDWDLQFCLEAALLKGSVEFEHRMLAADGRVIWLRNFVTVQQENNRPAKLRGVMVDSSENKRTMEALRNAQMELGEAYSQLAAIIELAPAVAIQGYDESGVIKFWNRASEEMYGFTAEVALGKKLNEFLLSPEDAREFETLVQTALHSNKPAPMREWQTLTASGERRHVLSSLFPIRFGREQKQVICMDVDVTARQQAESALRESDSRLRQMVENMPVMVDAFDDNGNIILWNRECERVTGYSAQEIVGNPKALELLYPNAEYRKRMQQEWQQRGNDYRDWEWEMTCKSGTAKVISWYNVSAAFPISGLKAWGIGIDVTQRTRTEEALSVSQERYQRLVEGTRVVPFEASVRDCRFVYIGPQAVKLLGYPREDWYREHFWVEHLYEEDRSRAITYCQEACFKETDFDFEYRMRAADGRVIWVREIVSVVRGESGPETLRGFLLDITSRKLAKNALLESQTRLKLLTSIATGITSGMSVEQIIARTVKHVNQHFPLLRISYANVDENGLLRVVHSHDPDGKHALIGAEIDLNLAPSVLALFRSHEPLLVTDVAHSEALRPLEPLLHENRIRAALYAPVHYADSLVGILGFDAPRPHQWREHEAATLREIAEYLAVAIKEARAQFERKRLEEERAAALHVANAELARAARLKDEFLASMSHELRTPLNAILGIGEALREQVYGAVNEHQIAALNNIEESGRHLLSLINDILDLSRIEAGKLELEIDPISVESVCAASLRFIHQMAQHKQLKISAQYDPEVKIIQADERRLKQVLVNLLSNAVKFTPANGTVGLEVWAEPQHETVHFTVWDTGIGISTHDLVKLFQPFVQLDSSLSREYPGTGLGLVLVHRMVELHGGGVSVLSEPGKGSRFTISLPWEKESTMRFVEGKKDGGEEGRNSAATLRATKLVTASTINETTAPLILIAEDNESNRKTLCDYLLGQNYRVRLSREGNEALACAREERPDLIVMDIQMRGMSGLEAIRSFRSEESLRAIPIIALTALAMPGDRERCLEAGASEYLSKPVSLIKLRAMIATQLCRQNKK